MGTGEHTLEGHRHRAPLKIPYGMATAICKDKALLKPLTVYFSCKPLYYSGVLCNAKARYAEIAGYIGICPRNLTGKLAWLKKHKLISFDHKKNLHLCSLDKLCDFINKKCNVKLKKRRFHELSNEGQTEYLLRTLAIHESRLKQKNAIDGKIFTLEKWNDDVEQKVRQGVIPTKTWERYHEDITRYTYKNRTLRKQKKMMLYYHQTKAARVLRSLGYVSDRPFNTLRKKVQKHYEKLYFSRLQAAECPEIRTDITLTCKGISRLFGGNSASFGHYWETKLLNMELVEISCRSIQLDPKCCLIKHSIRKNGGYYQYVDDIDDGYKLARVPIYHRTRRGERLYFLTLPNIVVPVLNGRYGPILV